MTLDAPSRTLELSKFRDRGIAVALRRPELFTGLFKLLWGCNALFPGAKAEFVCHLGNGRVAEASAVLLRRGSFRRKAAWALFWSLTESSVEIADKGRGATHEPELNGAFMTLIAKSIAAFPPSEGSNAAVVIGDHATLGNEARTGADFGLILEVEHRSEVRHLVVLLQAKRATARRVDVRRAAGKSTQLNRLVGSGIGSFLFYHAHNEPIGLGPTVRDADGASDNPASVDVLQPADDFAAKLAVAVDNLFARAMPYALPGMGPGRGRDDALQMLFNPSIPGLKVNDVVVGRVGDRGLSPDAIVDFENQWRGLVDKHRDAVNRAQGISPAIITANREPPLAQS